MPRPRPSCRPLPPQRYGPSATDLLRTATNASAVDAILAGALEHYQGASSGTKKRWAKVAAARKEQLACLSSA